ncbi:MAG: alpha/beta hydrolase, partial [Proteobacteria bacterium]|nr:alpha/beta hydrolase [Pseudomonadota bacterium]
VVIVVEGEDTGRVTEAMDRIAAQLAREGDRYGDILHSIDLSRLRAKGLYQLSAQQLMAVSRTLDRFDSVLRGDWSSLQLSNQLVGLMSGLSGTARASGTARHSAAIMETQILIENLLASLDNRGLDNGAGGPNRWPHLSAVVTQLDELKSEYLLTGGGRIGLVLLRLVHQQESFTFGDKADVHNKPDFFLSQGIAVISMNYRLRWDYRIFDQAEDVASVIVWVKNNAEIYGLDSNNIILMGHAAGAHLVSLVATNQSYLKAAGLSLGDIKIVVAIDTVSFDINRLMIELGSFIERRQHELIFGSDEEIWRQSSPIHHVSSGKSIPSFAILYVAQDEATKLQAMGFAKKLNAAEVEAIMIPGNEKTAQSINKELGDKGDIPTQALMAFIRAKI